MHNPRSLLENITHKFLWDFEIQVDHLISARRPDLEIINKKKRIGRIMDFVVPADRRVKLIESEKGDKQLDFARNWKKNKLWDMKVTVILIIIVALGIVTKRINTGTGELGNKTRSGNHPNYSIIEIGQNTEKSPGVWLRLVKLQWKTIG